MNEREETFALDAKELFKDAGYEKEKSSDERLLISYKKKLVYGFDHIEFSPINKAFVVEHIDENGSRRPAYIRKGEMDAIFKQLEEAGIFKKETNLEHFSDSIREIGSLRFAVVDNMPTHCSDYNCHGPCLFSISKYNNCDSAILDWMESKYKVPTYQLSRLEYDLLRHYNNQYDELSFNQFDILRELKDKGHFKNIPMDATTDEILSNCEVDRNDI